MIMRKIKFRAIPLGSNDFIKGNYAKTIIGNFEDEKHQILPFGENVLSKYIDVSTLGQYTGLNDENGVEIYEGDILISPLGEIFKISHRNAMFILENKNGVTRGIHYNLNMWKIIGSVHENPELLN